MDFFTRFTREKTPQNNFFSQNFSVENNYFNFFWNLILNFRFMMYDCAAQTKKNDKRIISLHKHYRNKSRYNWQNDYERFFFNLHTPWKSNCFLPLHKKKLYPVSKDSAKFIIKIIWMIYYIIKRIKQRDICIYVCSNGWMGNYPIIQVTKQSHCIFKFNLSSTQNYW